MNRTLLERAKSRLNNVSLQQELWEEAVTIACYLVNRSQSVTINCKIPKKIWTNHPCDYSNFKNFGCEAYDLIRKNQHSKLYPRSKKYIFFGYDGVAKGYGLWDPTTHKIVIKRDVIVDESYLIKSNSVEDVLKQEQAPNQQIQFESEPSTNTRK